MSGKISILVQEADRLSRKFGPIVSYLFNRIRSIAKS